VCKEIGFYRKVNIKMTLPSIHQIIIEYDNFKIIKICLLIGWLCQGVVRPPKFDWDFFFEGFEIKLSEDGT
jgi:hypothetical protein